MASSVFNSASNSDGIIFFLIHSNAVINNRTFLWLQISFKGVSVVGAWFEGYDFVVAMCYGPQWEVPTGDARTDI